VALLGDSPWEDGTRDEAETSRDLAWVFFVPEEELELSRTFGTHSRCKRCRADMSA
jgi:hypothetical protein